MGEVRGATRYLWVFVLVVFVWLSIFSLGGCSSTQQQSASGSGTESPDAADPEDEPSHDDVTINADRTADDFEKLITGVLQRIEP